MAVEEHVEGREEDHEERGALAATEILQAAEEGRRERRNAAIATGGLHRRARAIRREIERGGRVREAGLPVRELLFQGLALEPRALPRGVVAVLERERRPRRCGAREEGHVERGELAQEHAERPAVGDDVVHRQEQDVIVRRQPEEAGAEDRARGEIERLLDLGGDRATERRGAVRVRQR